MLYDGAVRKKLFATSYSVGGFCDSAGKSLSIVGDHSTALTERTLIFCHLRTVLPVRSYHNPIVYKRISSQLCHTQRCFFSAKSHAPQKEHGKICLIKWEITRFHCPRVLLRARVPRLLQLHLLFQILQQAEAFREALRRT